MTTETRTIALCAALALAGSLRAEPPVLLAPAAPAAGRDSGAALLPIPSEATPEQKAACDEVIAAARETDVSVTDQNALLYHGLMLTQDEEYEEAVPFLEEALRRDPSLQSGWEGLGWAYIKLGRTDDASSLWQYFRRLMPDQALPYALLAQLAVLGKDWQAADEAFSSAIRIDPSLYDVRFWHAQNLMRLGRSAEAETLFRQLLAENGDRLDVALNLAAILVQRLAYDEAVEIYRRVNAEIPGNTRFMLEQAFLEERVGELRAADQLCLDVLAMEPDNSKAMVLRADIAEISGQQDIRPFLEMIDETSDPVVRASLRMRLANRCHLANGRRPGQYPTAFVLDLIGKAIEDDPSKVEYRVLRSERLLEAGRNEECRAACVAILEKDNRHHARAKMLLFELAMREERWDDALQILVDRFGAFDSTDPMFHYYKARLHSAKGEFAEALREIDFMEAAARQGAVFTLLYHELTESDWTPVTSVRRLHEHILALQREGFELVSPADIPSIVGLAPGENRGDPPLAQDVPATARFIDGIRYGITGERKFRPVSGAEPPRPQKFFAVTFDDDQRSALALGTSVALEFGVPFAIFVPTRPDDEYVPSRAGWQELRDAAASGAWVVGSALHSSHVRRPVDRDGRDERAPLPNRIWLPEKSRLESMNEWDRRMRGEFTESRKTVEKEMGADACPVAMVAYPYGDVGQLDACNLSVLRNPSRSILSEAARDYDLGFLPSASGWTVSGDSLLGVRRYEPNWSDEGSDVVRHAYETHPEFVARRMRAEIAMLMNRPNLAGRMLELLRRDGYPEDLCRSMETQIKACFRNRPLHDVKPLLAVSTREESPESAEALPAGRAAGRDPEPASFGAADAPANLVSAVDPDAAPAAGGETSDIVDRSNVADLTETTPDPLVYLSHPFAGVEGAHSKANDQIETEGFGARAGLDLNRNTAAYVRWFEDTMTQTVRPRWNAIVVTNVPYGKSKYEFKAKTERVAGTISHRLGSGTVLSGSFGKVTRTPTGKRPETKGINLQDDLNSGVFEPPEEDSTWLLTLGARWYPRDNLSFAAHYDHGLVDSAVKFLEYHGVGADASWRPDDSWLLRSSARYRSYEDDNAMFNGRFESYWETNPDLGVWLGVQLSTDTSSEPSDFYWTPYWDERARGVLRYMQRWEGYYLRLDMLGGFHRSRGRADRRYRTTEEVEKVVYTEGVANTVVEEKEGTYVMEDESSGWSTAWGVDGSFEKSLGNYFDLVIEGSVTALRDYIDHSFYAYLKLAF